MRPGWLSVPAAHRNRPEGPRPFKGGCGDCERSNVSVFVHPVMSAAPVIRVVLVQLDPEAGALCLSGECRVPPALCNLPKVAQPPSGCDDDTELAFEILRLRACCATRPDGLTPAKRICGEHLPCRVIRQLDKHRLDVALSAGRHAAERAKLAGIGRLIGVAPSVYPAAEWWLPEASVCFDPYDTLRSRGLPEIAALVGVAIAAAQMGIPFCLPDPAGGVAADAAVALNPGVRAWLDPVPADSPGSVRSPAPARSLCAV